MRNRVLTAVTLWVFSVTSVHASDMPDQYSLYCKGEKATGFNWRSNEWVETNFKMDDYIIIKSPNNKCMETIDSQVRTYSGVMHTKDVCVNIREAGKQYMPNISGKCTEYYADASDTKWKDFLSCDNIFEKNFATSFNGWFHRASVHSDLNIRSDYKDSLVIEVGKCSQIN